MAFKPRAGWARRSPRPGSVEGVGLLRSPQRMNLKYIKSPAPKKGSLLEGQICPVPECPSGFLCAADHSPTAAAQCASPPPAPCSCGSWAAPGPGWQGGSKDWHPRVACDELLSRGLAGESEEDDPTPAERPSVPRERATCPVPLAGWHGWVLQGPGY